MCLSIMLVPDVWPSSLLHQMPSGQALTLSSLLGWAHRGQLHWETPSWGLVLSRRGQLSTCLLTQVKLSLSEMSKSGISHPGPQDARGCAQHITASSDQLWHHGEGPVVCQRRERGCVAPLGRYIWDIYWDGDSRDMQKGTLWRCGWGCTHGSR